LVLGSFVEKVLTPYLLASFAIAIVIAGCGASIDLGKSIEGGNTADVASNSGSASAVTTQPGSVPVAPPTGPAYKFIASPFYEISDDFEGRYVATTSSAGAFVVTEQKANYVTSGWDAVNTDVAIHTVLGSDGIWYQRNARPGRAKFQVQSTDTLLGVFPSLNGAEIPGNSFKIVVQENDISGTSIPNWINNIYGVSSPRTGSFPQGSTNFVATKNNLSDYYYYIEANGPTVYTGGTVATLDQAVAKCTVSCIVQTYNGMSATYLPRNPSGVGVLKLRNLANGVALADGTWERKQIAVAGGNLVDSIYLTFPDSVVASNTLRDGKYKIYIVNPTDGLVHDGWHEPIGFLDTINRELNETAFNAVWAALPLPSYSLDLTQANINSLRVSGTVTSIAGNNGRAAAQFAGDGSLRVANAPNIQFTQGATFDFWARIDSATAMNGFGGFANTLWAQSLIAKSHDRSGFILNSYPFDASFPGTGYGLSLFSSYDSSYTSPTCTTYIKRNPGKALGQWYRVTAMLSVTSGTRVYIDKELVHECSAARVNFASANAEDLYIGLGSSQFWYPLFGAVQDLRIYQSALNGPQVQALP
jgi:Concanavalin A-like lectin/glucanases superfamily